MKQDLRLDINISFTDNIFMPLCLLYIESFTE
jgi:hypothetical protein